MLKNIHVINACSIIPVEKLRSPGHMSLAKTKVLVTVSLTKCGYIHESYSSSSLALFNVLAKK